MRSVEALTQGGWPPPGEALPPRLLREDGEDDGLPVLLKDYEEQGEGSLAPKLVVLTGTPLVSEESEYLGKWLGAINLEKSNDCYLLSGPHSSHTLKTLEEILDYLQPKALLVLGAEAAQNLMSSKRSLDLFRDQVLRFSRFSLIVTHHPKDVLLQLDLKKAVWKDLQRLDGLIRYA